MFLYSYETGVIQGLLKKTEKKLAQSFNFTFRYIYYVLSLNNCKFGDFVDRIYPIELEIKDTRDTDRSASYLDLRLEIDSEGRLRTKLHDKRDHFNFPIVIFPFICSNIPAAPACGVYISQMIRYSRACCSYQDFLDRGLLLTRKLLNQGSVWLSWCHHFELFSAATMTWLTVMEYLCHKWPRICSTCRNPSRFFPHSWLITGIVTRLTRRVSLVEQERFVLPELGSCYSIFSFICMFYRSLFVLLYFFLLAIVLSVLRYTNSDYLPLIYSNSSYCTNKTNALRDNFSLLNLKLALVFVNTESKLCLFSITLFLIFLIYM